MNILKIKNDYTYTNSLPIGTRSEVFSINSLKYCSKIAVDRNSSEYLTYFFKEIFLKFKTINLKKFLKIKFFIIYLLIIKII